MDPINYKKKQADILVNLLSSRKYEDVIRKAKPLIKDINKNVSAILFCFIFRFLYS